jgi:hypothetical protein
VAVSYDSVPVLKHFADRKGIAIPLLSDADSSVIRSFGILNESVPKNSPFFGVPHPVTYIVNERGVIVSRHFEDDFTKRLTTGAILSDAAVPATEFANERIELKASATDSVVRGGERVRLFVDVKLPRQMHVYAPGVQGYIPIRLAFRDGLPVEVKDVRYPTAKSKRLEAIGETVPVFEDRFRIEADVIFGQPKAVEGALAPDRTLALPATLRFQACDERKCYVPEDVALKWAFRYEPHDSTRVPPELRRLK